MGLSETVLFYLLIGLAVALAVWTAEADRPLRVAGPERSVAPKCAAPYRIAQRLFRAATAIVFWPLYLPILLAPRQSESPPQPPPAPPPTDELSLSIAEVERELDAAFSSLDGWAEDALARDRGRIAELRAAWIAQAERIREMDRLLAASTFGVQPDDTPGATGVSPAPNDASSIHQSEQARRANFARLHQVRQRAYNDLTATLARVRELVSLIHLAKFTGAPASRAEQLVAEIAANVESLSEVAAWRDGPAEANEPPIDSAPNGAGLTAC